MEKDFRTYTREWFASCSSKFQKNSASSVNKEALKKNNAVLSESSLVGSVDDVKANLKKMPVNGASSSGTLVQQIGVDNLVSILDADGDGQITSEEFRKLASMDCEKEFENPEDVTLSAKDLLKVYENAVSSDVQSIAKTPTQEIYTYKDGSKTTITRNSQGEIIAKSDSSKMAGDGTKTLTYDYVNSTTYQSITDGRGRAVYQNIDAPGVENDKTSETSYHKDGTKTHTVSTVGKVTKIEYDERGRVASSSVKPLYDSDGKIGTTYQQDIGECWALSGVNALNTTSYGRKLISDSIKHNSDGSVTVTLKGVGKSYTYSAEKIALAQYTDSKKSFAAGDTDMNLLEMAISDYRKELSQSVSFKGLSINAEDPLKGGWNREALKYLTGQEPTNTYTSSSTKKMLEMKQTNPDRYPMTTSFKANDEEFNKLGIGKIVTGHVYSISRVANNTVYLINPWDSSKEIPYSMEAYLKNADGVSVIDMTKVK